MQTSIVKVKDFDMAITLSRFDFANTIAKKQMTEQSCQSKPFDVTHNSVYKCVTRGTRVALNYDVSHSTGRKRAPCTRSPPADAG
ncbi:hypothetical protein EVAR_18739_1 [Eumeta japonica]|uniref:Uncharacterized protein n=1 Tax=Eumeta variegata TaxID=151549 RepID=A0A4C1UNI0_EUMVA|nr:hypothetical protein EVAR_18739_1 [Eumeta japonica]